jgi:hypothetical protein
MKNIKVMKKEYIVIEKEELEGLLNDINLFATMVNKDAREAKLRNCDFVTGLLIDKIAAMSNSTVEYISEFKSELK